MFGSDAARSLVAQATTLPPSAFGSKEGLWLGIVRLHVRNRPVTLSSVATETSGAIAQLAKLAEIGNAEQDVTALVRGVRKEMFQRGLVHLQSRVTNAGEQVAGGGDPAAATDTLRLAVDRLRSLLVSYEPLDLREVLEAGVQSAKDFRASGHVSDITAGVHSLDEALGGLRRGGLHVFGFRSSDGKTTLGLQLAIQNAIGGRRAILFSLEMDARSLGERAVAFLSKRHFGQVAGEEGDAVVARYEKAAADWEANRGRLIVYPDRRMSVLDIRTAVRDVEWKHGAVDLVLVDHAQIVESRGEEARYRQLGNVALELFGLAKDTGLAVVLFTQLNPPDNLRLRDGEKLWKKGIDVWEPLSSDVRESRDLELHASSVVFGWTRWEKGQPKSSWFKIHKARHARRGAKIPVRWCQQEFRFVDYTPSEIHGEPEDDGQF